LPRPKDKRCKDIENGMQWKIFRLLRLHLEWKDQINGPVDSLDQI
jgi:hypothetical protein